MRAMVAPGILEKKSHSPIQMPHPGMKTGVGSLLMRSADSAIQVTDEGIIPVKTHGQISHVAIQPRTVTAGGAHRAPRNDHLVRAVRGGVILTLVLGSLGAAEAGTFSHASASHAAHHSVVSKARHGKHARPMNSGSGIGMTGPWMW